MAFSIASFQIRHSRAHVHLRGNRSLSNVFLLECCSVAELVFVNYAMTRINLIASITFNQQSLNY